MDEKIEDLIALYTVTVADEPTWLRLLMARKAIITERLGLIMAETRVYDNALTKKFKVHIDLLDDTISAERVHMNIAG